MWKAKLTLVIFFTLGFIISPGTLTSSEANLFPPFEGSEEIIREKDEVFYVLPLGKITRGNLAHPDEPMPDYSVPLEGIPLTGLAYIKPAEYIIREGQVEKITLSWPEEFTVEEVLDLFRTEIEEKEAEILTSGQGEDWEKWGTWHLGYYPLEQRERILKGSQDHRYFAGLLRENGKENFFSFMVFQGTGPEGKQVFSQLDIVDPGYNDLVLELDRTVPRMMDHFQVPGVAIALVEEGEINWTGFYGLADVEQEIPLNSEHIFRAGSISKTVLAWGVMDLVEKGQIDLEAPVEKYLTRWEIPEDDYSSEEVTVRRLLSHTAGFPPRVGGGFDPDEDIPPLEDILAGKGSMGAARINREPGESFLYSNPGYVILELLIEEITGEDFADFIAGEILNPLGLDNSTFSWSEVLQERMAEGYLLDNSPAPVVLDAAKGPGGLYSTVEDLARFLSAGITEKDGNVLSPESKGRMFYPEAETLSFYGLISDHYGLGYFLETLPTGQKGVFHGGQNTGWLTSMYGVPETGDGIVILTNSERSQHLIARVLGMWAEKQGYESVKMSRTYSSGRTILNLVIGILFFFSLAGLIYLGKGIVRRERYFAPFSPRNCLVRIFLALGFAIFWGPLFWATGQKMIRVFLPAYSHYLALTFLGVGFVLLVGAIFPRREKRNSP